MEDDKVFKPSFYTATIVFTVTVLVLVLILAGIMASLPDTRQHMAVFVPVVALGGAYIVVMALIRIRKVEKAYVLNYSEYKEKSHRILGCPDSYVSDGKKCTQRTSVLTLDESLVSSDKARSRAVVQHVPPALNMDMNAIRESDKGVFVQKHCTDAQFKDQPWATYRALCPTGIEVDGNAAQAKLPL